MTGRFLLSWVVLMSLAVMASQASQEENLSDSVSLAKFSSSLYKVVCGNASCPENKVFSPLSVATVLSMVYAGARGNTSAEIKRVLHLAQTSEEKLLSKARELFEGLRGTDKYVLETANRVYAHEHLGIVDEYQSILQKTFGTSAGQLDFGQPEKARALINGWVEEITHHKIENLIPQGALDEYTRLVLVNAVYFKGAWQMQFDPDATKVEPFYPGKNDEPLETYMMHNTARYNVGVLADLNASVLELPYVGDAISMFIILPDSHDDLTTIEEAMTSRDLLHEAREKMTIQKTRLAVPKFKIEFDIQLKEALQQLGLNEPFDEKKADLSGISGTKDLFVSAVFHKAFIDVNEEGSEAAAATAGVVRLKRSMEIEEPFIVNRPFIFVVQHKPSALWLFAGKLNQPQAAVPEPEPQTRVEL